MSDANVGRPKVEVLICIQVFPAPPTRSDEDAMVESPVPPEVPASAVESVSAPVEENDEVAVAPKRAVLPERSCVKKFVEVALVRVVLPETVSVPVAVRFAPVMF